MPPFAIPLVTVAAVLALIWFLGSGRFGRRQTQGWIDRFARHPRLHACLNRHHGKFRAAAHYFQFGGLFLALYWIYDAAIGSGQWRFDGGAAAVIALISMVAAYLDELHQLRSGSREFRRVDLLHSCAGIAIAAAIVAYQAFFRGV
jgi:hypothetical protein